VIGSDSVSAREKSWPSDLFRAFWELASPNSSIRSDGYLCAAAAVAARTLSTLPFVASWRLTRAE
jgi:hypothetical protein